MDIEMKFYASDNDDLLSNSELQSPKKVHIVDRRRLRSQSPPEMPAAVVYHKRQVGVVAPYQKYGEGKINYHRCEICKKCFAGRDHLLKHRALRHQSPSSNKFPCKVCGRLFTRHEVLKTHMFVHNDYEQMRCGACGVHIETAFDFRTHMFDHSQSRPRYHMCHSCKWSFYDRSDAIKHKLAHVEHSIVFECEMCHKVFDKRLDLEMHVRGRHWGQVENRMYYCGGCPASFSRDGLLQTHLLLHQSTENRVHRCLVCGKAFYREEYLNVHMVCYHDGLSPLLRPKQ